MRCALGLATLIVIGFEWWCVQNGYLSGPQALAVLIGIEGMLICGVVCLHLRQARKNNTTLIEQLPALKILRHEWWLLKDLYRLLTGIRVIPDGAIMLLARQGWWQIPAMFTVAIMIEIVAVDLVIPWPTIRVIVLVISLYGLIIMWGVIASRVVHPHYLSDELVLRDGRTVIGRIPINEILDVRQERSFHSSPHDVEDDRLILGGTEGTNVSIILRQPQEVATPKWPWQSAQTRQVTEFTLWLDEPEILTGQTNGEIT